MLFDHWFPFSLKTSPFWAACLVLFFLSHAQFKAICKVSQIGPPFSLKTSPFWAACLVLFFLSHAQFKAICKVSQTGDQTISGLKKCSHVCNRVIRKVRKAQHQSPEFGHTEGEMKKKPPKKYINIRGGMKLRKPSILVVNWGSSCLSFFMSASNAATCIFTASNCTTTSCINCWVSAFHSELHHFIMRFNKMCLLCGYHWRRG